MRRFWPLAAIIIVALSQILYAGDTYRQNPYIGKPDNIGTFSQYSRALIGAKTDFTSYTSIHRVTEAEFSAYTTIDREITANKDTDATLAANSDIKYPSQKAVKGYIDVKTKLSTTRSEFYGPRGTTLNSLAGHAFARWRAANGYVDDWGVSLDRVEFAVKKASQLGITTVTDVIMPGNSQIDWPATYTAAGDFTAHNFAADDWTAADRFFESLRKHNVKVLMRIPNGFVNPGDTVTKYSSTDYLNKYLIPYWSYVVTRYSSYSDVIIGIDWGWETSSRYGNGSTYFSNTLTTSTISTDADEWVSTHVALRNAIRAITTAIPVCLPSTYGATVYTPPAYGNSVRNLLDQMYAINSDYVNQFDGYVLIDYYSHLDGDLNNFRMKNNDPYSNSSYWNRSDWLSASTWDALTADIVTALDGYGRTDVRIGAPEGGHSLVAPNVINMSSGSGSVVTARGRTDYFSTDNFTVGEHVTIGTDGVDYTITALNGGTPAGSEMTVTPVSASAKTDERVYRKDREADQYWSMRWVYNKINKPSTRWGFFNWFQFWDNSDYFPLNYPHYQAPGVSGYAQKGTGFVESDSLQDTVRTSTVAPMLTGLLPDFIAPDMTAESLNITSAVESSPGTPSFGMEVIKPYSGGVGGIAKFENNYSTNTNSAPFMLSRSLSGGACTDNTQGGALRFTFNDGAGDPTGAQIAAKLLEASTLSTLLTFSTQKSGNLLPVLAMDENQNIHLRQGALALNTANSATYNLILNNGSTAPSAPVTDSVALRAADISGAGTAGLKILTENGSNWSFGSVLTFPDGSTQSSALVSGALNTVPYSNGSGGFSSASRFKFDGTTLSVQDFNLDTGFGTTPAFLATNLTDTSNYHALAASQGKILGDRSPVLTSGYVAFSDGTKYTGDSAHVWDNTNKRLGIGTTGPITPIDIYGTAAATALTVRTELTSTVAGGTINLRHSNVSDTYASSGDRLGMIQFGSRSGGTNRNGAQIRAIAEENFGASAAGAGLRFVTATPGSTTLSERISISASGLTTFTNGAGFPYGQMYSNTSTTIPVAASGTWYEVDTGATDFTAGRLKDLTHTDHYLTAPTAGDYHITATASFGTTAAGDEIALTVMVNGTNTATCHGHATVVNATTTVPSTCVTILTLAANDQISLAVQNHSAARDITISHAQLAAHMVGSP